MKLKLTENLVISHAIQGEIAKYEIRKHFLNRLKKWGNIDLGRFFFR